MTIDATTPSPARFAALPPQQRRVVQRFGTTFAAARAELYVVGGPVRDLLIGGDPPADLDFCTDALPDRTQTLGLAAGAASVFLVGERFGTVGFHIPGDVAGDPGFTIEITTYRREEYPDASRKPAVSHDVSLVDDLSRRDFTVNAMAAHPLTGELVDPFGGQADLAMGVLRAVGDPDERFDEDPLRLLRAARFVAQLGFRVEPATFDAMTRHAPTLERISVERIHLELTKLLCGRWADAGLDVLLEAGLFDAALPELAPLAEDARADRSRGREKDLWAHTTRVVAQSPARPIVRWSALLHDAAKPATRSVDAHGEVHFFGHERVGADLARRLLRRLNWSDSAVRRLMLEAEGHLDDLLDLAAADVTSAREAKQRAAASRVAGLRAHITRLETEHALDQLQSPLDGVALMAMFDRPPGRWIAILKDHLRELVIDGDLAPGDIERATALARDLVASGAIDLDPRR